MTELQPNVPSRQASPLVQIAIGAILGTVAVLVPWACGASQRHADLPRAVQCRLDALQVLPADIGHITVYDAIDIYERVRACDRPAEPDAEAP